MGEYNSSIDKDALISHDVSDSVNEWAEGTDENDEVFQETTRQYEWLLRLKYFFILGCIVTIFISAALAITLGAYDIKFLEVYRLMWEHIQGTVSEVDHLKDYIIWELRMPRIVVGVFAGAALAVAGAVMQSVLRNPMADSYTTGVSSGAGFGATLAIAINFMFGNQMGIVILAFAGSLIPILIIFLISRISNGSPTTMIMAGIGTMFIFNAVTTIIKLGVHPDELSRIYAWQVGSLDLASWEMAPIMGSAAVLGILVAMIYSGKINVLATGDESAKTLGVDADTLRILLLCLSGLLSASIVCFVGLIGFVGLVAPHICRMFIGADNRYLIPATALFGATVMLVADQIGQHLFLSPLPVGVIMAFFGGPVFIWLIIRRNSRAW